MNLAKTLAAVSLAFGLAAAPPSVVLAQDAFVGSWVLDTASSKGVPGLAPTAGTLEVTRAGDGQYAYVSEATVSGATGRSEVTLAIDGKDYTTTSTPLPPGGPAVTQAIERVSDTVYKISVKLDGQLMATSQNEISSDGNTLTQTTTGLGQFAALSSTLVFRRK
jgi:hypothetical protein